VAKVAHLVAINPEEAAEKAEEMLPAK